MINDYIYFNPHTAMYSRERQTEDDIEYIRKDIVDEMLEVAEDHAYFAGSEAMREKLSKLEELADKMYHAAQYLTTDASRLHNAMEEYRQYVINELKEDK